MKEQIAIIIADKHIKEVNVKSPLCFLFFFYERNDTINFNYSSALPLFPQILHNLEVGYLQVHVLLLL